jgi:helix-turn-helix protein
MPMSTTETSYLTLSQVAVRTGRHPELLRQWCASGRLPCARVGGSWVMLERDVALIDGIASRARRGRGPMATATADAAGQVAAQATDRVLAAVFDDAAAARLAAATLRDRLGGAAQEVGTVPLAVPALSALSLTVVAGRVAGSAAIGARRLLAAFGGRVIADIEEIRAAPDLAPAGEPEANDRGKEPAGIV